MDGRSQSIVTRLAVKRGGDGQWYWHAQAGNNEIVATSEGYTERNDAVEAALDVFPHVGHVEEGDSA